MIRILLADDHPIVREGLRAVLETQADFAVVAEAASGDEAVRLGLTVQPDILLLDLEMPIMDGVEAIRRLPRPLILYTTLREHSEHWYWHVTFPCRLRNWPMITHL